MPARADRRAAVDAGAADRFEAAGPRRPALAGLAGTAGAQVLGDPVALALMLPLALWAVAGALTATAATAVPARPAAASTDFNMTLPFKAENG